MKRKKNEQFVKHKMFYLLHVFLFFNKITYCSVLNVNFFFIKISE